MTGASKRGLIWVLYPVLVYVIGFTVLWFPLALRFSTHYWTSGGDGFGNLWNFWWVNKALFEQGSSPWFTDHLFHPDGISLLGHTLNPFNGFLAIPLGTVLSSIQVFNTIFVFSFVASGYTCFLLAYKLSRSYLGSLFAGGAFTFSSYHLAHALGHTNLVALEWIPLFVLLWIRLLEAPSIGRGAWAAGAFFAVLLCDYYYAFYCAIAGFLLLIHRSWQTGKPFFFVRTDYLVALGAFAVLCIVTSGAIVFPLLSENASDPFTGAHDAALRGADLLAPVLPGGSWRFSPATQWFWERLPSHWVEADVFLGWTVLVLVIYSFRSRKREGSDVVPWILGALVFFVLSLGPVLHVFGTSLPAVPMPYRLLRELVPILELGGVPARMNVMVILFLSIAASFGCETFFRRVLVRRWAMFLFLVAFVVERIPYQMPAREPLSPDYVEALAALPPGAVDGLAGDYEDLRHQTRFDKPMTSGWAARIPRSLRARADELESLRRRGRYRELFERYDVRYLIRPMDKLGWPLSSDLKAVFVGRFHVVYALEEDPLPEATGNAPVDCSIEARLIPGPAANQTTLLLRGEGFAEKPFRCLFSLGTAPPVLLPDGRRIPLRDDETFRVSTDPRNRNFIGSHGEFDDNGEARILLRIPGDQDLSGTTVYFSVTLVDSRDPYQLGRVCRAGSFILP